MNNRKTNEIYRVPKTTKADAFFAIAWPNAN